MTISHALVNNTTTHTTTSGIYSTAWTAMPGSNLTDGNDYIVLFWNEVQSPNFQTTDVRLSFSAGSALGVVQTISTSGSNWFPMCAIDRFTYSSSDGDLIVEFRVGVDEDENSSIRYGQCLVLDVTNLTENTDFIYKDSGFSSSISSETTLLSQTNVDPSEKWMVLSYVIANNTFDTTKDLITRIYYNSIQKSETRVYMGVAGSEQYGSLNGYTQAYDSSLPVFASTLELKAAPANTTSLNIEQATLFMLNMDNITDANIQGDGQLSLGPPTGNVYSELSLSSYSGDGLFIGYTETDTNGAEEIYIYNNTDAATMENSSIKPSSELGGSGGYANNIHGVMVFGDDTFSNESDTIQVKY